SDGRINQLPGLTLVIQLLGDEGLQLLPPRRIVEVDWAGRAHSAEAPPLRVRFDGMEAYGGRGMHHTHHNHAIRVGQKCDSMVMRDALDFGNEEAVSDTKAFELLLDDFLVLFELLLDDFLVLIINEFELLLAVLCYDVVALLPKPGHEVLLDDSGRD